MSYVLLSQFFLKKNLIEQNLIKKYVYRQTCFKFKTLKDLGVIYMMKIPPLSKKVYDSIGRGHRHSKKIKFRKIIKNIPLINVKTNKIPLAMKK